MKTEVRTRRDRILDAGEELFCLHGYDGVTLRQIATKAGVDVALTNYHFGKKGSLFEAVFLRRAEILNERRQAALDRATDEAGPDGPSIEEIITAFLLPIQEAQEGHDPGWRNYCALVALINNSPVWGKRMMSEHFDALVNNFIEALRRALPDAKDEDIYWGYHFFSGALSLTMAETGRIDQLSGGICKAEDVAAAYSRLAPFVAAGFREIC